MIVAIVALIAALGGTAIAGGGFLPKNKFKKFSHKVVKKHAFNNLRGQVNTVQAQANAVDAQAVKGPVKYVSTSVNVPNTPVPVVEGTATCPAGTKVLGGGARVTPTDGNGYIDDSYPSGSTSWKAKFDNNTGSPYTGTVTAICAASP